MLEPSRAGYRASKWFALLGLAGLFACARHDALTNGEPPQPSAESRRAPSTATEPVAPAVQAPAEAPHAVDSFLQPVGMPMTPAMSAADRWLRAVRDGDEAALTSATLYPFEWRSTDEPACPAKQPVETGEQFSPIVTCLFTDSSLRRALPEHDLGGIVELPIGRLQDWAQPWRPDVPRGATFVNAFVKRSDLQVDMDLWVVDGSVQAFWMHAVDGSSEVGIVKRWLEALKNRDTRALAEVTSFPFEVRDKGREAKCGKRTATSAGTLNSATQCLLPRGHQRRLRAAQLGRALVSAQPPREPEESVGRRARPARILLRHVRARRRPGGTRLVDGRVARVE